MINAKGIVQNNTSTDELLKYLKSSSKQYKILTYKKERELIEKYMRLVVDSDGKPVIDHIDEEGHVFYKYDVIGDIGELKKLLIMHHIKRVFNLSKKYAQYTRDFDDLIAKGMYGLVYATDRFGYFSAVMKPVVENGEVVMIPKMKNGEIYYNIKKEKVMIPKLYPVFERDEVTPKYVKFITYATNWILKFLRDEFNDKQTVVIDNNSISLNDSPRIKNSTDHNQTYENTIENMLHPNYHVKTFDDELSSNEVGRVCEGIYDYVMSEESNLSAIDKQIFVESFYNHKNTQDIADELEISTATIINRKKRILKNVKGMLKDKMGIENMNDILLTDA